MRASSGRPRVRHPARASTFVLRFNARRTCHCTADGLCDCGILRAEDVQVLLHFWRRAYRIVDPGARCRLVDVTRESIFDGPAFPDLETGVLVTLTDVGGLLPAHFARRRLRERQGRLSEIAARHVLSESVSKAVRGAQQAVMIGVVAGEAQGGA